jgi:hypothetical protein
MATIVATDLQSKINRAIRVYLIGQGAVSASNCFADPVSFQRSLPLTHISTGEGTAISDQPGNIHFPNVLIKMEDAAVVQPNMADPQTPRVNANTHWSAVATALKQSNDVYTLNYTAQQITAAARAWGASNPDDADLQQFTMLWWEPSMEGAPTRSEDGTFWAREIGFGCIACDAALAA